MSWRAKRIAKQRDNVNQFQRPHRRKLRIEALEPRALLTGFVDIQFPAGGGPLTLVGDGSNNQVEIQQTTSPNEFRISSPDDTLFQINGVGSFPEATVNGITGVIKADLRDGNDNFSFLGVSPGVISSVPSDLTICNRDGSDVNIVSNVLVNRDLRVTKTGASSGYSELRIVNSTVIGETIVDNVGNGTGDTKTVIDNSKLQAGGGFALQLFNPAGSNLFDALGKSQFGSGSFHGAQPVVYISNLGGGSRTTFTGANQVAGPNTITVYGEMQISNGANLPGTLDVVTLNSINVLGAVSVTNGSGNTDTMVINSTLGSQFDAGASPVVLRNDDGFDAFTLTDSTIPWGLEINNDEHALGGSTWGSSTQITNSFVGTHPPILSDTALFFQGDNGADTINLQTTSVGGILDIQLRGGNNNVTLLNNASSIESLNLLGGIGNDRVTIDNTRIIAKIDIDLDDGADTLTILHENYATQWPNPLLASIEIDGGLGFDTFSGVVPPSDIFQGFDSFTP